MGRYRIGYKLAEELLYKAGESLGVTESSTQGSVVKDAPNFFRVLLLYGSGEGLQIGCGIRRVIDARASVKAAVEKLIPSSDSGRGGDSRWIDCDTGDVELLQEGSRLWGEPARVARLKDGRAGVLFAKQGEEGFRHS